MKVKACLFVIACTMVLGLGWLDGDAEAHLRGGTIADQPGPAPGEQYTSLSSATFTYSVTDLSLPGPMPINVTRVYRSNDFIGTTWQPRDFGIGTKLNYDIYLHSNSEASNGTYTDAEVGLPDGGLIGCQRSDSNGPNNYLNAQFVCNEQPTGAWFGSTITYNNSGWDLKRTDGTTFHFGDDSINQATAPLQTITDRWGNQITINRGGSSTPPPGCTASVPAGPIVYVSTSNGRTADFCYDTGNIKEITGVYDNQTPTPVKGVSYTYDTTGRLSTVTNIEYSAKATTTYQYNQASPNGYPNPTAGLGNISTITVNAFCSNGTLSCTSPSNFQTYVTYINPQQRSGFYYALNSISSQLPGNGYAYTYAYNAGATFFAQVSATLPDGTKRYFYFDSAGYLTKDVRNPQQPLSQEITEFKRSASQPIGALGIAPGTTEFISEVWEEDPGGNALRQTHYTYDVGDSSGATPDRGGNFLSTAVSPQPGQTSSCYQPGPPASYAQCATRTYSYTNSSGVYDTYGRLTKVVEPLAYNGTGATFSYSDPPNTPTMTVTDPLGRSTTVTYNSQGQSIKVQNDLGNISQIGYASNGDLQSTTDAKGAVTKYVTDADGRATQVTTPMGIVTQYVHDPEDHVISLSVDPNHFNIQTLYGYDLIGEIASLTTPNGNTTKWTRNANLTTVTVTDPDGKTTVTDLDGEGINDFWDKRGVLTTFEYDIFGRLTFAQYNTNNKPGYLQIDVGPGILSEGYNGVVGYDALDRLTAIGIDYEQAGNSSNYLYYDLAYTYDGVDNVLKETETPGTYQVLGSNHPGPVIHTQTYSYDLNDRRTNMTQVLNGYTYPVTNYAYDCADELVLMSNDGSSLTSCGPSTSVNYTGNRPTSTQTGYNYDGDGALANSIVNGITTTFSRDADEQPTSQTFTWGSNNYNLTYQYDLDGRLTDEGGSPGLATINLPNNGNFWYNAEDQISSWNDSGTQNVTYEGSSDDIVKVDPSTNYTYAYDARLDMTGITGGTGGPTNTFDALGRRNTFTYSPCNGAYLLHEGLSVSGYECGTQFAAYLTPPGGGAPSSLYLTQPGYTDWDVPLNDVFGSTLAVIDTKTSGVSNSYSYDPNGKMGTLPGPLGGSSGRSPWGFLWHGLENEPPDALKLYWEPNGNIYNPDPFKLSASGPEGMGGGMGGGVARSLPHPGNQNANLAGDIAGAALNVIGLTNPISISWSGGESSFSFPLFGFDGLFPSGGAPSIPRYDIAHTQRGVHPVLPETTHIRADLLITQQGNITLAGDDKPDNPEGAQDILREGQAIRQIKEFTQMEAVLDYMGRPTYAHTDGGFLKWLQLSVTAQSSPVTPAQADAIAYEAQRLGLQVRLDAAHTGNNPWQRPHLNIIGKSRSVHVFVPSGYNLP